MYKTREAASSAVCFEFFVLNKLTFDFCDRYYINSKQQLTLEILKIHSQFMAELTFSYTSCSDNDEKQEEDTNGGHVHPPEMTIKVNSSLCGDH